MTGRCVLVLAAILPGPALAADRPAFSPMAGPASVATHLRALHYGEVKDLRRGVDGTWTATTRQGGVSKVVTVAPDGRVNAR